MWSAAIGPVYALPALKLITPVICRAQREVVIWQTTTTSTVFVRCTYIPIDRWRARALRLVNVFYPCVKIIPKKVVNCSENVALGTETFYLSKLDVSDSTPSKAITGFGPL